MKWVGGKRQLLKQFSNLYPNNFNPIENRYFEPFVGGGGVFFDLQPQNTKLSDWNKELVTTYPIIRDNVEDLIDDLKNTEIRKRIFFEGASQRPD